MERLKYKYFKILPKYSSNTNLPSLVARNRLVNIKLCQINVNMSQLRYLTTTEGSERTLSRFSATDSTEEEEEVPTCLQMIHRPTTLFKVRQSVTRMGRTQACAKQVFWFTSWLQPAERGGACSRPP